MWFFGWLRFMEWWAGLSPWLRLGIPAVLILVSTLLLVADVFWPWGWAVGTVLLLFSGPDDSERNGYNF